MEKLNNKKSINKPPATREELLTRLNEAEDALNAIRNGIVDAIIVNGDDGEKLYTLTSAETPYRTIIEEMNEGAVTLNPEGVITYCNKKFGDLINEPCEKITGTYFSRFIPEDQKQKFEVLFKAGIKSRSSDELIFSLNGKVKYMYLSLSALPPDMLSGVCIIATDINDRKNAEMMLKESNEKLVNTQRQLIHFEKLASLGRFSTGIAHEIRNPLANISSLAQLLNKEKIFDQKFKQYINYILINTEIANKIIRDLLSYASPDVFVYKNTYIVGILNKLINIVSTRCKRNNITIEKKFSKRIPVIKLNEEKLESTFMNFISNAIEAMPNGGKLRIMGDYNKAQKNIVISFEDTGVGIPEENIDKLFEPFFTTKKEGTGLGLSLAYNIITAHSGKIEVESKENIGTTFKVYLPSEIVTVNNN